MQSTKIFSIVFFNSLKKFYKNKISITLFLIVLFFNIFIFFIISFLNVNSSNNLLISYSILIMFDIFFLTYLSISFANKLYYSDYNDGIMNIELRANIKFWTIYFSRLITCQIIAIIYIVLRIFLYYCVVIFYKTNYSDVLLKVYGPGICVLIPLQFLINFIVIFFIVLKKNILAVSMPIVTLFIILLSFLIMGMFYPYVTEAYNIEDLNFNANTFYYTNEINTKDNIVGKFYQEYNEITDNSTNYENILLKNYKINPISDEYSGYSTGFILYNNHELIKMINNAISDFNNEYNQQNDLIDSNVELFDFDTYKNDYFLPAFEASLENLWNDNKSDFGQIDNIDSYYFDSDYDFYSQKNGIKDFLRFLNNDNIIEQLNNHLLEFNSTKSITINKTMVENLTKLINWNILQSKYMGFSPGHNNLNFSFKNPNNDGDVYIKPRLDDDNPWVVKQLISLLLDSIETIYSEINTRIDSTSVAISSSIISNVFLPINPIFEMMYFTNTDINLKLRSMVGLSKMELLHLTSNSFYIKNNKYHTTFYSTPIYFEYIIIIALLHWPTYKLFKKNYYSENNE